MKQLHLICNAHLDPVWQWDWNEGATAALATFYAACEIAEEYDYIFCHNEALLYEFVETYDPALFERIGGLVKAGKWHIMGGWYVQPDCNIPSGEGFVRQIESGLSYFKEKFGVIPTAAVNFDSFGHTQGLVQILSKCGYSGYICCRPMKELNPFSANYMEWKGFDGSSIKAARFDDLSIYTNDLGAAVEAVKRKMKPWNDQGEEIAFALWGVGNHGGGASRKDLSELAEFMEEQKAEGVEIFHSTPEAFFAASTPKAVWDDALQPCFVKCYTSISRMKRRYAEVENKLLSAEKICAYADAVADYTYNLDAFKAAQKKMAMVQFHDVLSGTCIIEGEKSSMQKLDHALELLDTEFTKAFMALAKDYEKAVPLKYPIFVYNPTPYAEEAIFTGDFFLLNGICSDTEGYEFTVKRDGADVPFQIVKESSCISVDRSKRMAIKTTLNPLSMTRFDVEVSRGKKKLLDRTPQTEFVSEQGTKAVFDPVSGGLASYAMEGKEYLKGAAFTPVVYDDNPDPWGWHMSTVGKNYTAAVCKTPLRVIERGDLLTTVESLYETGKSDIRVAYTLYKDFNYIDVTVNVYWNDAGKGLKLEIPVAEIGKFLGQTAFGTQTYKADLEECSQRFVGMKMGDKVLTVFKDGTYGCSLENGKLYLDLLNGSVYCAHPVGDLPIMDEDRFQRYIDLGRHEFTFRLEVCDECDLDRKATSFTQKPYALNFYPHGTGKRYETAPVILSDPSVTLSCFRKTDADTYMVRLYNGSETGKSCTCDVLGQSLELSFGKYEVKTLLLRNGELTEQRSMLALS